MMNGRHSDKLFDFDSRHKLRRAAATMLKWEMAELILLVRRLRGLRGFKNEYPANKNWLYF